jgi:branched-chain amino acid transport system ATP-binding protein
VLLEIAGLSSHYGRIRALLGVDLEVAAGELVVLVGANGAGKTTLLRTISGIQPASAGRVRFDGADITGLAPDRRVRLGITQVPEGRQLFGPMSVEDNLRLGAFARGREHTAEALARAYELFPVLGERRRQPANTLSGGEQQMLAISRALMARPRLLLLDEPSMGLAPKLVEEIFRTIRALGEAGTTIFLVEQNAAIALSVADRGYVLETGRIVLADRGQALLANERVKEAYTGAGSRSPLRRNGPSRRIQGEPQALREKGERSWLLASGHVPAYPGRERLFGPLAGGDREAHGGVTKAWRRWGQALHYHIGLCYLRCCSSRRTARLTVR